MTITDQQQQAIREYFAGRNIPAGLGNEDAACSMAGINLALSGRLTAEIPECMSEQIGYWIMRVQDAMPDDIRNSASWRELLPRAAGTGREHEDVRSSMILEWMWGTVLPYLQPIADKGGYGDAWRAMCQERTANAAAAVNAAAVNAAAYAASYAADAAAYTVAKWASYAADAAAYTVAKWASYAADAAADAAMWAAGAEAAAYAAKAAADAGAPVAAYAAAAAANAAAKARAADAKAWEQFDPCGLLERLIAVSEEAK